MANQSHRELYDKMAGAQAIEPGLAHNTFWLQQPAHTTNKGTFSFFFLSGGRREMSFVKVPIRCALSHLYPIDSMTLGRSVERLEQFLRAALLQLWRRGREQGERCTTKGKKKLSHEEPLTIVNLIRYLYIYTCIIHSTIHSNNNKRIQMYTIFAGAQSTMLFISPIIQLLVGWFLFVAFLIVTFSLFLYANPQCRTIFFFFSSLFSFSHLTEASLSDRFVERALLFNAPRSNFFFNCHRLQFPIYLFFFLCVCVVETLASVSSFLLLLFLVFHPPSRANSFPYTSQNIMR